MAAALGDVAAGIVRGRSLAKLKTLKASLETSLEVEVPSTPRRPGAIPKVAPIPERQVVEPQVEPRGGGFSRKPRLAPPTPKPTLLPFSPEDIAGDASYDAPKPAKRGQDQGHDPGILQPRQTIKKP